MKRHTLKHLLALMALFVAMALPFGLLANFAQAANATGLATEAGVPLASASVALETVNLDAALYGIGPPDTFISSSGVLQSGVRYQLSIVGNWSAWPEDQVITKVGHDATIYESPSVPGPTQSALDAAYRYDSGTPEAYAGVYYSVDGGVTFNALPRPQTDVYDTAHSYTYIITGTGSTVAFRTGDTYGDDHGVMQIAISSTALTPVITWSNPGDIVYGAVLNGTQLNATADVAGSFVYSPDSGTVLGAGNNQNLHVDFIPNDTANYNSASMDVKINVLKEPASVTPNAASKTYGTSDPALTGTLSGFLPADNVTATYSRAAGETVAGSPYLISATLSPAGVLVNYNIIYNTAAFTISQALASVTPNAASKTYGTSDPALTGTLSGFLPADNVTATYSRAAGETVAGSPYLISATLSPAGVLVNYNITYNTAAFTISQALASVTPNAASKTYGTSDPALTGTLSGFLPADNVTATYSRAAGETVAGSPYLINATLSPGGVLSNYTITYNTAAFTINKALASVTPNAASKTYGQTLIFAGTEFTASGLLNGDTITSVTLTSSGAAATAAVSGSPYPIVPSAAVGTGLSNYTISYVNGLLTVNKANTNTTVTSLTNPSVFGQVVTFTANVTVVSPGGGTPTNTVTFNDTIGSTTTVLATVNLTSGQASYTTTSPLAPGNHTITAVYSGDSNFIASTSTALTQTVKSGQDLKKDAAAELQNNMTGDKEIDGVTKQAIGSINDSLAKNLWSGVDGLHLVFQPKPDWRQGIWDRFQSNGITLHGADMDDDAIVASESRDGYGNGITVFHDEKAAADVLERSLTDYQKEVSRLSALKNLNQGQQVALAAMQKVIPVYKDVLSKLVTADNVLAQVAITQATTTPIIESKNAKIVAAVTYELKQANNELTQVAASTSSSDAIYHYGHAWFNAEMAIQFANMAPNIDTTSLPNGVVGIPYLAPLDASGGTPPYTWSAVASSALPGGLSLSDNKILGKPTTVGTFTFTVQVTDRGGGTDTQSLSITIAAQPPKR